MRCWLGHRWLLVATQPYLDTSWGATEGVPHTALIHRCRTCGWTREKTVFGRWSLVELTTSEDRPCSTPSTAG